MFKAFARTKDNLGWKCLMIFRNAEKCFGGSRNLSGQ
jgi:hypothetical protein